MADSDALMGLRKLVYGATTAVTPNFGGHHGIYGFEAGAGTEILKQIDTFIGKARAGKANAEDIEAARGQCSLGRTMNILSESDLEKADAYLDEIKEKL